MFTPLIPNDFGKEILFEVNGFTAQLCCTEASRKLTFQLRYLAYRHANAILERDDKSFTDHFDSLPNARIHLLWYEGKPIATVRGTVWSSAHHWSPPEGIKIFWEEVHRSIGLEKNILESSRFAVSPDLSGRKSLQAQLLLFRILDLSTQVDECEYIITAVREKHVPFYQRMLAFDIISEPKDHEFIDSRIVLLATQQEESRAAILQKGMPACTPGEVQRYAELVDSHNLIPQYHG